MLPGPPDGQHRTRDVIATELLDDALDRPRESGVSEERRSEAFRESEHSRRAERRDFDDEEPVTDVDILTGPAAPE